MNYGLQKERQEIKDGRYWLCIPRDPDVSLQNLIGDRERMRREYMTWFKINDDVYQSKEYPTCRCGRKYVPIEGSKICYFCEFNDKKPI